MALDIFEADDSGDSGSKYEPPTFRLSGGMKSPTDTPVNLPSWRFTSDDRETLERLAELYGGEVSEFETKSTSGVHVITNAQELDLVVDVGGIESSLILWGANGPLHKCDGSKSLLEDDYGQACGCPSDLKTLKENSAKKPPRGPSPYIKVTFRLADDLDLKKGELIIGAWGGAASISQAQKALEASGEESVITAKKEFYSFTDNATQKLIEGYKGVYEFGGSYNNAITGA